MHLLHCSLCFLFFFFFFFSSLIFSFLPLFSSFLPQLSHLLLFFFFLSFSSVPIFFPLFFSPYHTPLFFLKKNSFHPFSSSPLFHFPLSCLLLILSISFVPFFFLRELLVLSAFQDVIKDTIVTECYSFEIKRDLLCL